MRTAIAAIAATAGLAQANILTFSAFDHIDGAVNPQAYGLRLDGFGGESPVTFTFENDLGESNVTITIDTVTGSFLMSGTVTGNSAGNANNGGPTDFGTFFLSVSMTGVWDEINETFIFTDNMVQIGTLTGIDTTTDSPIGDGEILDILSKSRDDYSFQFGLGFDDDRLPADTEDYAGVGWVLTDESSGTQDFLFTAVLTDIVIPTPAAVSLFGLAGIAALRRRR